MADSIKLNNDFKGKDIISLNQFSPEDITTLFTHTNLMKNIAKNAQSSDILKGNIITLIFYESSSRTFGSFSAAMKQLGGQTVEIQNPQEFSSVSKGETLEDTIRVFEAYSDAIVIRHPQIGTALKAADAASFVPIINAGDGIGEHPTQALLDLYTIYEKYQRLGNLTVVFAGDILNGRTIHSLLKGLSLYKNNKIYLLSPKELRLDPHELSKFIKQGLYIMEIETEKEIPKNADIWYWTRVQKERFASLKDYDKVKNRYIVTKDFLKKYAGKETMLMHPLPRVGEIHREVDTDERAVYLSTEIRNGMYIRMALLGLILGKL
ncbi:aspartate carbamoyltransferase [Candidatus Levyibacteriota bacterium]|nr:aspartate carbamoyltransferase [Candidatus Levybacteria bacterium]MSU25950.1 aspartate carbamoyltransferase [Candidatus Levybacteria bacterium]GDX62109.1 aspartate carbamoyltransferase [Candidatus Levybacteria bacterium]